MPMHTLDWLQLHQKPVLHYGALTVRAFYQSDALSHAEAVDAAKRLTQELRSMGYAITRRGHWIHFGNIPLADMVRAAKSIGVGCWPAFRDSFNWRLIKDRVSPPEPQP